MGSYLIVFKAGYDVEAPTVEKALKKARRELLREIRATGVTRFVVDVEDA